MSKWVASWATERRSRFARICNLRYSASGKFLIFRVATAFFPPFFLHLVSSRAMTVKADAPADLASRIRSRGARCVLRWQRHTVALPCALRARQTNHWRLRRENQPAAANHRERGDVSRAGKRICGAYEALGVSNPSHRVIGSGREDALSRLVELVCGGGLVAPPQSGRFVLTREVRSGASPASSSWFVEA